MKKTSKSRAKKKIDIISFCAHNDDHILGAGGTLAKYAREGKRFATYIFSYGESSHPWLKQKEAVKMRVKESFAAKKILGGSYITYFGVPEGKFKDPKYLIRLKEKIKKIVKKEKPEKIFTHSVDDPHPDHRAVLNIVIDSLKDINFKGDLYSFEVWNPINLRKRSNPKMVVDTSKTFKTKMKAFYKHKSQKLASLSLIWKIYLMDFLNGFRNHCRYAEVFYKVEVK